MELSSRARLILKAFSPFIRSAHTRSSDTGSGNLSLTLLAPLVSCSCFSYPGLGCLHSSYLPLSPKPLIRYIVPLSASICLCFSRSVISLSQSSLLLLCPPLASIRLHATRSTSSPLFGSYRPGLLVYGCDIVSLSLLASWGVAILSLISPVLLMFDVVSLLCSIGREPYPLGVSWTVASRFDWSYEVVQVGDESRWQRRLCLWNYDRWGSMRRRMRIRYHRASNH